MELPHLDKLYKELSDDGLLVLSVARDSIPLLKQFVEYNHITHPVLVDRTGSSVGDVFKQFHALDGVHYLIDGNGNFAKLDTSDGLTMTAIRSALAKLGISSDKGTSGARSAGATSLAN